MEHVACFIFHVTKVLPLIRWKKVNLPKREEYSDIGDSNDEDSEPEEVVIPRAKKRILKTKKQKVIKRKKLNPKPLLKIPNANTTKRDQTAVPRPPPGSPPKRIKPDSSKPSNIPSRR